MGARPILPRCDRSSPSGRAIWHFHRRAAGRPPGAEEPRKSHVGEVVEEVIQDADESGFHLNLQDSGIWFALFLILTGVTYIAAIYLELDVWLWSVAWPSALLCLGLSSCTSHLSAFGLGASAAGLYFLLVNLGVIPLSSPGLWFWGCC